MHLAAISLIALTLLVIAYQDYTTRMVHWVSFPLLAAGGILVGAWELSSLSHLLRYAFLNLLFLALQFILLKGYYLARHRKNQLIIDKKIGLGDILFLSAAAFFFSPLNFIFFYVLSLVLSLLFWSLRNLVRRSADASIPLAGYQASFLLLAVVFSVITGFPILNDSWAMSKILRL